MKSLRNNKLLKTFIALLLCLLVAIPTLMVNSYVASADIEHVIRDYSALDDTKRLMIGGFYGDDVTTDEGIARVKNSGLDFITQYGQYNSKIMNNMSSVYDKLHDAGLKIMLAGGRGTIPNTSGMHNVTGSSIPYNYSAIYPATSSEVLTESNLGKAYNDAMMGTDMWDEPLPSEITDIAKYVTNYETLFGTDKLFFVNLFPEYASYFGNNTAFNNYVESYATNVLDIMNASSKKVLSVDTYPLLTNGKIQPKHFTSLATIALIAKNHGADVSYYVQSMNPNLLGQGTNRDVIGQADINMQYNIAMAFGAKRIINFCYQTPSNQTFKSDAMVTASGVTTPRYTWVKNASDIAHSIGEAYMRFNWNGTIISKGTDADRFSAAYNDGYDCFSSFTNSFYKSNTSTSLVPFASTYNTYAATRNNLSGNNLLSVASSRTSFVGCFTDDEGYNGYMIASGDDAVSAAATAMALTFDSSTEKVRIYRGTTYTDQMLTNHALEIGLYPGEGAFVVPYKAIDVKNVTLQVEGYDDEVIKVEDGGSFVFPDRLSGVNPQKALIGYTYNGATYPVGYEMTGISENRTITARFIDLTMDSGASVRIDSDTERAIRWTVHLKKSDYSSYNSQLNVQGYGVLIMSPSKKGALNIPVSSSDFIDDGTYYKFAGVMTHVEEEDLACEFEARAYIRIRFSNGETKNVYARGNNNLRSISQVATAALNDGSVSWNSDQLRRLEILAASYEHTDNLGSLEDWISQNSADNVGSLDYWLRWLALNT